MNTEEFDYVIVGAGSAGCVLANRLTEDPACRVAIIEAGGSDRSIFVDVPSGFWLLRTNPKFDWGYSTVPEPGLDGRRMLTPRGRALGGSSTINGLMYIRGHPLDYDGWVAMGASGWSYAEVLPYFKRAETFHEGGDDYRGGEGPLKTARSPLGNPLYHQFLAATEQAGYCRTGDLNGFHQDGFGACNMTIANGRRCSAAHAYLHPVRGRANLRVISDTLVERIVIEGNRAVGIVGSRDGQSIRIDARIEVISAAGAVNSPQLLMLSGIGPGADLRAHGIPVAADLPGVGQNLMDHLSVRVQHACLQPVTRQPALGRAALLMAGLRWLLFKSGVAASNQFEVSGYLRSRSGLQRPDTQLEFIPFALDMDGEREALAHGFQTYASLALPNSRGTIRLRSSDPAESLDIQGNYLAHDEDRAILRAAIRSIREIMAQPAFDPFRGAETAPGPAVHSDNDLDSYLRETSKTVYHLCGTCRMGNDAQAVVDAEGRVHGVAALRVVDASLMPRITCANTNATTIMMAEKLADSILGKAPLAPSDVGYYEMPDWQTKQRPGIPARKLE